MPNKITNINYSIQPLDDVSTSFEDVDTNLSGIADINYSFSPISNAGINYSFNTKPVELPELEANKKYRDLSSRFWARFKEGVVPDIVFGDMSSNLDEPATSYELITDVAGSMAGIGIGMIPFALMTGTGVGTGAGALGLASKGSKALKTARTLVKAGRLKGASKILKLETSGILGTARPYVNTMARLTTINPGLAKAVDLGARNFITFNAYGQAHIPSAASFEQRMDQMKADAVSSAVFTTAGLFRAFNIPKVGTKKATLVDDSLLFLAGAGGDLGQSDMDMSERIAHGLGLIAMRHVTAGADRKFIKIRQQTALRKFGYTEKEISTILSDDKILNEVLVKNKIKVGQRSVEEQNLFTRKVNKTTENVDLIKVYTNKDGKQMAVYRDTELNIDYTMSAKDFFKGFKKISRQKTILEKEKEKGHIVDNKPIDTIPSKGDKGYNTWSKLRVNLKSLQKKQKVSDSDYRFLNKKMVGVDSSKKMTPSQLARMVDLYRIEKKSNFSAKRLEGNEHGIMDKLSESWKFALSSRAYSAEATLRGIAEKYNSPTATKLADSMVDFTFRKAGIQGAGSVFLSRMKKVHNLSKEDMNRVVALIDSDKFGKFKLTDKLKTGKFTDEKGVNKNLGKQILKEYDTFMKQMFTWMADSGVKVKTFKGNKTVLVPIWQATYTKKFKTKEGSREVIIQGSDLRYPSTIVNKPLKKGSEVTLKTGEKVKLTAVESRANKDYFPRILTAEARKAFRVDDSFRARVVERIMEKDPSISKIKNSSARRLAAIEKVNEITNYTENRGVFGAQYERRLELPARIALDKNGREIKLESFDVKVGDVVNKSKIAKIINVYETDLNRVIPHYVEKVSHQAPTSKVYGHGGVLGDKANNMWTKLSLETRDDGIVSWAKNVVKIQTHGHEMSTSGDKVYGAIKHLWGFAANIGLSSPTSGLKNLLLGQRDIFTTFNFRSVQKAYFDYATRKSYWRTMSEKIGALQLGTHQLQALEQSGFKPIQLLGKLSFMKPAEHANRSRAVVAGLFTARDATDVLVGNKTPWKAKMSKAQARHYLETTFKFDVDKILKRGKLSVKEETQAMTMAHVMTQGAPELPFIPPWMSHPYAKPLTLFYRIAYRVTENLQKNVWIPLASRGNPVPLLKYLGTSAAIGSAQAVAVYHKLLGMEPSKFKDMPDTVFENMMRTEYLGIFSNGFDEFGGAIESYTPFMVKLASSALNETMHALRGTKTPFDATKDYLKENYVLYNHTVRLYEKSAKPDFTEAKRFKNLVNQFKEDVYDAKYQEFPDYGSERSPYYRLVEQAFWSDASSEEKSQAYWTAYWFIAHSLERDKLYKASHARKQSRTNLKKLITRTQPVNLNREKSGKRISDYRRFLKSLNAKDYNRYLNIYDKWRQRRDEWNIARSTHIYGE